MTGAWLRALLAALAVLAGLTACSAEPGCVGACAAATGPTASPDGLPARASGALTAVHELRVRGRGPKTGYTRAQFGPAWADVDRNGCDTRNDVLARDLHGAGFRPGTRDCVVLTGTFREPYTGRETTFDKADAAAVQIDHVVALSDAWQKGAAQWTAQRRLEFANDPLELLAADGRANQAKGDSDTASWLPPDPAYRCRYVARQVAVKRAYALAVTAAERDAMVRVLTGCPGEPLPTAGPAPP